MLFHHDTFELLGCEPQVSAEALVEIEKAEQRLGTRFPPSLREWYSCDESQLILAAHSNDDPPIPIKEFTLVESKMGRLLPIRWENQGVCTWAVHLNGADDPPVVVDVDSNGTVWRPLADTLSTYIYTCVWDYRVVFKQLALVQAQNGPLSLEALQALRTHFDAQPSTFGWPGSNQYRFADDRCGILIWSTEEKQADWFVGAADQRSLESALRLVWNLDAVGKAFYDCSEAGKLALTNLRART